MTDESLLSQPILLDVCKDGTVTIRERGQPSFNGAALPVYGVEERATARAIREQVCKVARDEHPLMPGEPWYFVPGFEGRLSAMDDVRGKMKAAHERLTK